MKNKLMIIVSSVSILLFAGAAVAFTSYGNITGYATVEQSIVLDIMGSSNDFNYTLDDVNQGEIKYSPKIKLVNKADVPLKINMTLSSSSSDVNIKLLDENKTAALENPIEIPVDDLYVYIEHTFDADAELGNYTFSIEAIPFERA